jgi:MFS family permease
MAFCRRWQFLSLLNETIIFILCFSAWIGSFQYMCYLCLCPASGILTQYFSFRPVVLLGSILLCLGLLLSSFVNDIPLFYLTYGLIFGTGVSLLFMSSVLVLPIYFQRHLTTATGLVIAANSSFTMWYAPLYEYLIRRYGWRVALRIVTCFLIPLLGGCTLFPSKKKVPRDRDEASLKVKESLRRLLKNKEFLIWFLLMTLVYLWQLVPTFHLVR